jgi:hypothetical protein
MGGTSWEAFLLGGHVPITDPRQGVTLNGLPAKSALGVGAWRGGLAWGLDVKVINYCVGEKGGGTTPTYYDTNQYVLRQNSSLGPPRSVVGRGDAFARDSLR